MSLERALHDLVAALRLEVAAFVREVARTEVEAILSRRDARSPASGMLTTREVAQQLKVKDETVRTWIGRGELAATRLGPGRGWRVSQADLDRWLARTLGGQQGQPDPSARASEIVRSFGRASRTRGLPGGRDV